MRRKQNEVDLDYIKKKIEKHAYKYKNHISKLEELDQRLEKMGISIPDGDTMMWVYLQSFKDEDILTDKYIFNFGVMDEETKKHIGEILDYGIYYQTITEMKFSEFKHFYKMQAMERELLSLQYPGLIMDYVND